MFNVRVNAVMSKVNEPPSQTEGSGTFNLALYNVRSGRAGGLVSALRAIDLFGVDLGLFQETKCDQTC